MQFLSPDNINPGLHSQSKPPSLFKQCSRSGLQTFVHASHSLMSVISKSENMHQFKACRQHKHYTNLDRAQAYTIG